MPHGNQKGALAIDELPRLTEDDREALEDGYVALQGVPASEPPRSLTDLSDAQCGLLAEAEAVANGRRSETATSNQTSSTAPNRMTTMRILRPIWRASLMNVSDARLQPRELRALYVL